jgi:hypothetical protein
MIDLMHYAAFFLCLVAGTSMFTNSFINSAVSVQLFIPSGGRVGAARLSRHMAQYRV